MPVFCYTIRMNFKLIIGGVLAIVVTGMIAFSLLQAPEDQAPEGTYVDEDFVPTRPAVQARPNTFNVMTPEEKAAAQAEAARVAAEQAALAASSSATSSATSTDSETTQESDEAETE
jgi:hypothetical protein